MNYDCVKESISPLTSGMAKTERNLHTSYIIALAALRNE